MLAVLLYCSWIATYRAASSSGVLLEPAEPPLSGVVGGRIPSLATKSVVHVHRISVPHVIGERI